jgi:hypothetical protein
LKALDAEIRLRAIEGAIQLRLQSHLAVTALNFILREEKALQTVDRKDLVKVFLTWLLQLLQTASDLHLILVLVPVPRIRAHY